MQAAFELGCHNDVAKLWRAAQALCFEILDAKAVLDAYYNGMTDRADTDLQDDSPGNPNPQA